MEREFLKEEKEDERAPVEDETYFGVFLEPDEGEDSTQRFAIEEPVPEQIRLYVPDTNNFGHQATCLTVLYRLMEEGYNPIRVIYHSESVWPKLAMMIPGLPEEPTRQFQLGTFTLYFDEYLEQFAKPRHARLNGQMRPDVDIVVTGAFDNPRGIIGGSHLHTWLGGRLFLVLQPCQWASYNAVDILYRSDEDSCLLRKAPIADEKKDPHFNSRGYCLDFMNSIRAEHWHEELARLEGRAPAKYACLTTLLELHEAGQIELCPIYCTPNRCAADPLDLFCNLLTGISAYKHSTGAPSPKKASVVVMLGTLENPGFCAMLLERIQELNPIYADAEPQRHHNDFREYYNQLAAWHAGEAIRHENSAQAHEESGDEHAAMDARKQAKYHRAMERHCKSRAQYHLFAGAALSQSQSPRTCTTAGKHFTLSKFKAIGPIEFDVTTFREKCEDPDSIVLVSLADLDPDTRVPRMLFDHLFSIASLPCAFEGMGTLNLALNLGRPFFHLLSGEHRTRSLEETYAYCIYPSFCCEDSTSGKEFAHYCHAVSAYLNWSSEDWLAAQSGETPDCVIGSFLLDACGSGDSSLKGYFAELGRFYSDRRNDKLTRGLELCRKTLAWLDASSDDESVTDDNEDSDDSEAEDPPGDGEGEDATEKTDPSTRA